MRVIVAGSRSISDPAAVADAIDASGFCPFEVVSGGANGVDLVGELIAEQRGWRVVKFKADWLRYGRGAGPLRNQAMADYADALVAVWDGRSSGTGDMIKRMQTAGKPAHVVIVERGDNGERKPAGDGAQNEPA